MSVIVTLRMKGDAAGLEKYAGEHPDEMSAIVDRAKSHGLMAHRFTGATAAKSWSSTSGRTSTASRRSSARPRVRLGR